MSNFGGTVDVAPAARIDTFDHDDPDSVTEMEIRIDSPVRIAPLGLRGGPRSLDMDWAFKTSATAIRPASAMMTRLSTLSTGGHRFASHTRSTRCARRPR